MAEQRLPSDDFLRAALRGMAMGVAMSGVPIGTPAAVRYGRRPRPLVPREDTIKKRRHKAQRLARKARRKGEAK